MSRCLIWMCVKNRGEQCGARGREAAGTGGVSRHPPLVLTHGASPLPHPTWPCGHHPMGQDPAAVQLCGLAESSATGEALPAEA